MRIIEALAAGGVSSAQIMVAVAAIGVVLGVVNETGVAIRFATSISAFGDDYLIIALMLAMFGALILGMTQPLCRFPEGSGQLRMPLGQSAPAAARPDHAGRQHEQEQAEETPGSGAAEPA